MGTGRKKRYHERKKKKRQRHTKTQSKEDVVKYLESQRQRQDQRVSLPQIPLLHLQKISRKGFGFMMYNPCASPCHAWEEGGWDARRPSLEALWYSKEPGREGSRVYDPTLPKGCSELPFSTESSPASLNRNCYPCNGEGKETICSTWSLSSRYLTLSCQL